MTERSAHYAREVNAEVRDVYEKINHDESHDTIDGHTSYTPGEHATFAEHATVHTSYTPAQETKEPECT